MDEPHSHKPNPDSLTSDRVLVMVADPQVSAQVRAALDRGGFDSTIALDEGQARAALQSQFCNLLLTDSTWSAGMDIVARLRTSYPDLVCVALVVDGPADSAVRAMRLGFSEFVRLPFSDESLIAGLYAALERESGRRESSSLHAIIPLYELSQAFMRETDLSILLNHVVEVAVRETGAQRGSLMLIEPDEGTLRISAAVGLPEDVVRNQREMVGQGIAGWVAQTGRALIVNNDGDLPEFLRTRLRGGTARSAVCLPLTVRNKVIGVINLTKESVASPPFTQRHADMLSVLAAQAAIAIENAQLFSSMEVAYDELRRLDQFKTQFINIAAHELRTPVAIILGFIDLLAEDPATKDNPLVDPIVRYAQRLHTIVDALFQASNLSAIEATANFQEVNLIQVIEKTVRETAVALNEKDHQMQVSLPPEPVIVVGDSAKLGIVIGNLLSNAVKFTPQGGQIQVQLNVIGSEARMVIQDSGIGIPESERERIFKSFYQVEPSDTRLHGGLGLGLAIARGLVELHRGRIWLDSSAPRGAQFVVALPLAGTALPAALP